MHHTQGGGYSCVPGMANNGHYANQEPRVQLNSGRKLGATYAHKFKNCPQLMDSVFLTPTSSEPYDPYEVNCLFKIGKLKKNGLQLKYFTLILVNPKDFSMGNNWVEKSNECSCTLAKNALLDLVTLFFNIFFKINLIVSRKNLGKE